MPVVLGLVILWCLRWRINLLTVGDEEAESMGRSWLADEQWGKKVQEGREDELCKCISCLRCFESLNEWNAAGLPPECALNPRMAREKKYGDLPYDSARHSVVVVGGGPSGMMAAKTLAERGCKVTLMDRGSTLGGTVNQAKAPPLKERMEWVMDYYRAAFEKLGVEVRLNTEATADLVAEMQPDAVIVGTGSKSVVPAKIPGITGSNVYTVEQVLSGKADLSGKKVTMLILVRIANNTKGWFENDGLSDKTDA